MFRKYLIFLAVLALVGVLTQSIYRGYVEAYVQEITIPIGHTFSANFETKLTTKYKVVVALKRSYGLKETYGLISGGDAYERSENLGRYVLDGFSLKIDALTGPDIKIENTFSVFGGAPAYENTSLEWDPHASYRLASFQGKAGSLYRITVWQEPSANPSSKPVVPAYLMIRKANDQSALSIYAIYAIVSISILIALLTVFLKGLRRK